MIGIEHSAIGNPLSPSGTAIPYALAVFAIAVAWDLVLGEPPAPVHPVVLIGSLIARLRRIARPTRLHGAGVALIVIACSVIAGHILIVAADAVSPVAGLLVAAFLLKSTLALRSLLSTSSMIGRLIDTDMQSARKMLPSLVGRKTEKLTRSQGCSAVIESLSENFVDTVVSPIFYYCLLAPFGLGVHAALAFKAMSTMDSMLAYKTPELIDLGYVPAKLDDAANYIPARISIVHIALASPLNAVRTLRASFRDHARTPSPNSGWPMAAAAGALGIKLEKVGYYSLNDEGRSPETSDIRRALVLIGSAMGVSVIMGFAFLAALA